MLSFLEPSENTVSAPVRWIVGTVYVPASPDRPLHPPPPLPEHMASLPVAVERLPFQAAGFGKVGSGFILPPSC